MKTLLMNLMLSVQGAGVDVDAALIPDHVSWWDQFLAMTLFGSMGWAIVFGIAFLIVCFASDFHKNGFGIFAAFVAMLILFHFWGSVALWVLFPLLSWKFLALYFSVGLGYSVLKTFLYAKNFAKDHPTYSKDESFRNLKGDLGGNVFRWWFAWPISMIVWVFSDLLVDLFEAIWPRIRGIFESIAKAGISAGQDLKED